MNIENCIIETYPFTTPIPSPWIPEEQDSTPWPWNGETIHKTIYVTNPTDNSLVFCAANTFSFNEDGCGIFEQDLPGYSRKQLSAVLKKGVIEITASSEDRGTKIVSINLHEDVDTETILIKLKNGVLRVTCFRNPPFEKQLEIK